MKKHIALFALSAAALMGLGACGEQGGSSESESSSSSIIPDTSVKITVDAPEGVTVNFVDAPEKYYGGETVTFTVEEDLDTQDVKDVKVAGKVVAAEDGKYTFTMPNVDVTIEVELKTLGDKKVLEVSDVDADTIPTLAADKYDDEESVKAFAEQLKNVVENSDALQGDYLREVSFEIENSPIGTSGAEFKGFSHSSNINPGSGKVLALTGNRLRLELSAMTGQAYQTYKAVAEKGCYGEDVYYTRYQRFSGKNSAYYGYQAQTDDDDIQVYEVVDDDTADEDFDAKTMVKATDAITNGTSFGIGKIFSDKIYVGSSTSSLTYVSGGAFRNKIHSVQTEVADDNKFYTLTVVSHDENLLSSGTVSQMTNTIVVDGDGFLKRLSCVVEKFNADDYDAETGVVADTAVSTSKSYSNFNFERGFKHDDVKSFNLEDLAMDDFEIEVKATCSWKTTQYFYSADADALTIEAGTKISAVALDYSSKAAYIPPKFLGTSDEGFLGKKSSSGDYEVLKVGSTKLVFDNWFGTQKEFDVTFTEPAPAKIKASFDKSVVLVDEAITLTASVEPAAASQDVVVALPAEDPTESTLVDNENGTWTITPTKAGSSSVTISSKNAPEVTQTLNFTVAAPATYDGLIELLPSVTFFNKDTKSTNYDTLNINFNADGTGKVVGASKYGSGKYGSVVDFAWTLDEATLDFTITQTDGADSVFIYDFIAVNSASFKIKAGKSESTAVEVEVFTATRVADLTTGPWVDVTEY